MKMSEEDRSRNVQGVNEISTHWIGEKLSARMMEEEAASVCVRALCE